MKLLDIESISKTGGRYRIEDIKKSSAATIIKVFDKQSGVCLTRIQKGLKNIHIEFTHNYEMCPVSRVKQLFRTAKRRG